MPFIQRLVEPIYVSRFPSNAIDSTDLNQSHQQQNQQKHQNCSSENEFDTISNKTLGNVLRQLASVVLCADQIFCGLGNELYNIQKRTETIKKRIKIVGTTIENDIHDTIIYKSEPSKFVDNTYKRSYAIDTSLFTESSRPKHIQHLYEKAAPIVTDNNVVHCVVTSSPILNSKRHKLARKIDAEIETRRPAAVEDLRKWTSSEAIGEITVAPNCLTKVVSNATIRPNIALNDTTYASFLSSYNDGIDAPSINDAVDAPSPIPDINLDHKLPSPEEQCASIARKHPATVVAVNTSEIRFERMCSIRKSLGHMPSSGAMYYNPKSDGQTIRRHSRRKSTGKRRNTISGIDDKELMTAYMQRNSLQMESIKESNQSITRSKSNDPMKNEISSATRDGQTTIAVATTSSLRSEKFRALKNWSRQRLKINTSNKYDARIDEDCDDTTSSFGTASPVNNKPSTIKLKQKSVAEKSLKQNPLYSSSDRLFMNLSPKGERSVAQQRQAVKMRSSMARKQRRNAKSRLDEPNSSSGNWSASSESGRTSASSEVTMPPKTITNELSTVSKMTHLNIPPKLTKRKFNTSTCSSIASDDTLFLDAQRSNSTEIGDEDDSSMYSCDTEGYFTSFHVDSGLKTLKEEEVNTVPALLSTSALSATSLHTSSDRSLSKTTLSIESDYDLFGKGSTSTTTSSAGTVCTTLLGRSRESTDGSPVDFDDIAIVNEVQSSPNLHFINEYGKPKTLSKTSMLNERESTKTPNIPIQTQPRKLSLTSDADISETSDFEGADHINRIHGKTRMTSTRIPSMCAITPLNSDDEERVIAMESMLSSLNINKIQSKHGNEKIISAQIHEDPTNMNENLLFSAALSPFKDIVAELDVTDGENIFDMIGEYVTLTDVEQSKMPIKNKQNENNHFQPLLSGSVNREYVSLNELKISNIQNSSGKSSVKPNANGVFVYDSNSLRYKKSLCSTFKDKSLSSDINSENNWMNACYSPPFSNEMDFENDSNNQNDVYVTLCRKNEPIANHEFSEVIHRNRKDRRSGSWPLTGTMTKGIKTEKKKRFFSWESLSIKKPAFFQSKEQEKVRALKSPSLSPQKNSFRTSTPLKESSNSSYDEPKPFGRSALIDSIKSLKPNVSIERSSTCCSDRLGVPKTSLNDFKKLLMVNSGKRATAKPSAVEQLKIKREAFQDTSTIKILDLSSSPKSFANRRMLHSGNAPAYKKPNVASPRSRWKYNSFSKNTISSIPEVNIEDEDKLDDLQTPTTSTSSTVLSSVDENDISPSHSKITTEKHDGIIETNFNLDENIFLQTEENNFMKGEIVPANFKIFKTSVKKNVASDSVESVDKNKSLEVERKTLETSL